MHKLVAIWYGENEESGPLSADRHDIGTEIDSTGPGGLAHTAASR